MLLHLYSSVQLKVIRYGSLNKIRSGMQSVEMSFPPREDGAIREKVRSQSRVAAFTKQKDPVEVDVL